VNRVLAGLRRLVPGTLMALLVVALSATGFWLHWTPRFQSLRWGATEMVHVWVGWGTLAATAAYLAHHLARTWGPLVHGQRALGLFLALDLGIGLVSGVLLVSGRVGGPPAWALPAHFGSTFLLLALFAWHSAVGWRRWLAVSWRALRDGPAPPSAPRHDPAASAEALPPSQAPQRPGPEQEGEARAEQAE
jgi:hypothetical protein